MATKHEIGRTERRVFKIGRSIAITLPKEFIEAHGLKKGDKISILYNSVVLLEPKQQNHILATMQQKKAALLKKEVDADG